MKALLASLLGAVGKKWLTWIITIVLTPVFAIVVAKTSLPLSDDFKAQLVEWIVMGMFGLAGVTVGAQGIADAGSKGATSSVAQGVAQKFGAPVVIAKSLNESSNTDSTGP